MSSKAIGRFFQGVAQVAVPAALEDQRAQIQKERDARLAEYRQQEMGQQQEFQAGESAKDRALRSRQHEESTSLQREQLDLMQEKFDLTAEETRERLKLIEPQIEAAGLEARLNKINLENAEDLRDAYETIRDPELTPAEREAAMEYINLVNPQSRYKLQQKEDEFGNKLDEFVRLDTVSGEAVDMGRLQGVDEANQPEVGAGGYTERSPAKPTSQDELEALPAGAVYRDPGDNQLYVWPGKQGGDQGGSAEGASADGEDEPARPVSDAGTAGGGREEGESSQPLLSMRPRPYDQEAGIVENVRRNVGEPIAQAAQSFDEFLDQNVPGRARYRQGGRAQGNQGTETNPVKVESQAEVAALPDGTWYVDPADGTPRQKKANA